MKSRAYNIRIGIHEVSPVPDNYGGYTTEPILISNSWARKEDASGRKATSFGITQITDPVLFKVRKRNDLPYNGRNLHLVYGSDKYIIQGIKEVDQELEILCEKINPVEIPLIGNINANILFYLDDTTVLYDNSVLGLTIEELIELFGTTFLNDNTILE